MTSFSEIATFEAANRKPDAWLKLWSKSSEFREMVLQRPDEYNKIFTYNDFGGDEHWYFLDRLHRDNDLPAIIEREKEIRFRSGTVYRETVQQMWYYNGKLHRDNDQPAVICSEGKEWRKHGLLHRENDKPAVIDSDGNQEWWYNGRLHREGAPAVVSSLEGNEWWYNGRPYREKLFLDEQNAKNINEYVKCFEDLSLNEKSLNVDMDDEGMIV